MVFSCPQGHVLTAEPSLAGQKVRCPVCQEILAAPAETIAPPTAILVGPPPTGGQPPPAAAIIPARAQVATFQEQLVEAVEYVPDEPRLCVCCYSRGDCAALMGVRWLPSRRLVPTIPERSKRLVQPKVMSADYRYERISH